MHKAMLLITVFILSGTLWAADPIIGTWKLNTEKSKFSPMRRSLTAKQTPPKERTEVYREVDGDLIEFVTTTTWQDGSSRSSKYTLPRQGGIIEKHLPNPFPDGMLWIETLIKSGNWYETIIAGGKQIAVRHKVISDDGKMMRQILRGVDSEGKPFEELEVYNRQ
jgi:hypothetical protein